MFGRTQPSPLRSAMLILIFDSACRLTIFVSLGQLLSAALQALAVFVTEDLVSRLPCCPVMQRGGSNRPCGAGAACNVVGGLRPVDL